MPVVFKRSFFKVFVIQKIPMRPEGCSSVFCLDFLRVILRFGRGTIFRISITDAAGLRQVLASASLHKLIGEADDFGRELFALCPYDGIIDGVGEACKDTAEGTDQNADNHC